MLSSIFLNKNKFLDKYFRSVMVRENFRPIELDSYVIKTNRFGAIINKDFFDNSVLDVKALAGVMRYNAQESVVFADWQITHQSKDDKAAKPYFFTGLLHLTPNSLPARFKIAFKNKATVVVPFIEEFAVSLSIQGLEGFNLSCDQQGANSFTLAQGLGAFFDKEKESLGLWQKADFGVMIFSPAGWLAGFSNIYNKPALDMILAVDRELSGLIKNV